MNTIPVIVGGAAKDAKPSVIIGGAEKQVYEGYVVVNGVAKQFYKAYDCQAQNYSNGGIAADGSLMFSYTDQIGAELPWFHLHFDHAINLSNGGDILIHQLYVIGPHDAVVMSAFDSVNKNNLIADCYVQHTVPFTADISFYNFAAGSYQDLYFWVNATGGAISFSAPAGSLYIAGQQINDVELI